MKVRFSKLGKGNYEFLTVAVTCLIVSAIFLFIVLSNSEREKIQKDKVQITELIGLNGIIHEREYVTENS